MQQSHSVNLTLNTVLHSPHHPESGSLCIFCTAATGHVSGLDANPSIMAHEGVPTARLPFGDDGALNDPLGGRFAKYKRRRLRSASFMSHASSASTSNTGISEAPNWKIELHGRACASTHQPSVR